MMKCCGSQLHQEEDQGIHVSNGGLTIRRLFVWICEPMVRLKALAALVDICQGLLFLFFTADQPMHQTDYLPSLI